MADIWIQGSFAFRCTAAECALIEEVANDIQDEADTLALAMAREYANA